MKPEQISRPPRTQSQPEKCATANDRDIFGNASYPDIPAGLRLHCDASNPGHAPSPKSGATVYSGFYLHYCPICGQPHQVNSIRHDLAHGRRITCSFGCEMQRRKNWKHRNVEVYSVPAEVPAANFHPIYLPYGWEDDRQPMTKPGQSVFATLSA